MAILWCWSCSSNKGGVTSNNSITVTILPIKYIVEQIVGNDFVVNTLVPPGASPETYEPTPQQLIALSRSEFVFSTGLIDFEQQLTEKLADNKDKLVELSRGIELMGGTCGHQHGHQHGVDPHIWTSPRLLKKMSETIYNTISVKYPDSTKYAENCNLLISRLDSLDIAVQNILTEAEAKSFIIYHPALSYYAQDYGIEQITIETDGKEPTADQLKKLINRARTNKTTRILYQAQFSRATVEAAAKDINAECIEIDPLSGDVVNNLIVITKIITGK